MNEKSAAKCLSCLLAEVQEQSQLNSYRKLREELKIDPVTSMPIKETVMQLYRRIPKFDNTISYCLKNICSSC